MATTCVTEWPHIPIYRKIIIIGMLGTTTTDVETQLLLFPNLFLKVTLILFFFITES